MYIKKNLTLLYVENMKACYCNINELYMEYYSWFKVQ